MNLLLGQAQVLLSLGDTAGATGALDAGLEGLARARPGLLGVVPETAAIPRAMLLRAELANQARDRRTARRWGGQAAALWKDADPVLAPLARRARALASE
jgi:hypothetical protein